MRVRVPRLLRQHPAQRRLGLVEAIQEGVIVGLIDEEGHAVRLLRQGGKTLWQAPTPLRGGRRWGSDVKQATAFLAGQDEDAIFLAARAELKRAYGDFVESTPLKEKVFKVFRDEEAKLKAKFVVIDSLKVAQ